MNGSTLISKIPMFRKQGEQVALQVGNVFSAEFKAEIKNKLNHLAIATYNVVSSPQARTVLMVVVMVLVCAIDGFAQTASKDLKTVIKDFQKFLYDDVRFALCIIGFAGGALGLIFSKNPDTRKQAGFAIAGAAFFAFGPGFLKFIADITGTANPQ